MSEEKVNEEQQDNSDIEVTSENDSESSEEIQEETIEDPQVQLEKRKQK